MPHFVNFWSHVHLCLPCGLSCLVQEEKVAVAKAKDFLEGNTYTADDPYTTALSAYALALLRSPYAPLALRRLNHMAITQGTTMRNTVSSSSILNQNLTRKIESSIFCNHDNIAR